MSNQPNEKLTHADLQQFTGTTAWYRHGMTAKVVYTDGIQYLAEHGGAYWLLDAIVSHLLTPAMRRAIAKDARLSTLQFWRLEVSANQTAVLTCRADSGETPAVTQKISYTDFPLERIDIWCGFDGERWTLYLTPASQRPAALRRRRVFSYWVLRFGLEQVES